MFKGCLGELIEFLILCAGIAAMLYLVPPAVLAGTSLLVAFAVLLLMAVLGISVAVAAGGALLTLSRYVLVPLLCTRGFALGVLAGAAVLTARIPLGSRSSGACCAAAAAWWVGLALLRHHGLRSKDGFAAKLAKNGAALAAVVAVTTGLLAALALIAQHRPPERIFEWSGRFAIAKDKLKSLEDRFKATLMILASAYLLILWSEEGRSRFAVAWGAAIFSGKWIKRMTLACTVVASFTFMANHTDGPNPRGGPLDVLASAKEEALREYTDLAWKIELKLRGELKVRAVSAAVAAMTQPQQEALEREARLAQQIGRIPASYFVEPTVHSSADQLIAWQESRDIPVLDVMAVASPMRTAAEPAPANDSGPAPPRDLTRSGIREAAAEITREKDSVPTPAWMTGPGKEVMQNFFNMGLNNDRVPLLKGLADSYPLLADVLDVGLDAIKDTLFEKVHRRAADLAAEACREGGHGVLARIHSAAAALVPRVAAPARERIQAVEDEMVARAAHTERAERAFQADLEAAIREMRGRIERMRGHAREALVKVFPQANAEGLNDVGGGKLADDLHEAGDSPWTHGPGVNLLVLRQESNKIEQDLADEVSRSPEDLRWREVLGADYEAINARRMFQLVLDGKASLDDPRWSKQLGPKYEAVRREASEILAERMSHSLADPAWRGRLGSVYASIRQEAMRTSQAREKFMSGTVVPERMVKPRERVLPAYR